MAYDDSGELPIASDPSEKNTYGLGGYNFELKVQNTHEPGEPDVVSVFAICRSPDGSRQTQATDFPAGTTVEGWYVEANETEASVYVKTNNNIQPLTTVWDQPIKTGGALVGKSPSPWNVPYVHTFNDNCAYCNNGAQFYYVVASSTPGEVEYDTYQYGDQPSASQKINLSASFIYQGKTVYFSSGTNFGYGSLVSASGSNTPYVDPTSDAAKIAWLVLYGESIGPEEKETLVGRFAIDIHEADGGPDGDWDEPGDVGPDPEKHYTLTVSVTGASSGSNSGIPLEAQEQSVYGSGGYGGNGGGGGAGASTVIIYDFATNKADNVVQEATAQGPGSGGPGGKGGKGGDGCILIFY